MSFSIWRVDILSLEGDILSGILSSSFYYICKMTTQNNMEKNIHQGHNLKRFREMLGIKQEALALDLGDDWNQKKYLI